MGNILKWVLSFQFFSHHHRSNIKYILILNINIFGEHDTEFCKIIHRNAFQYDAYRSLQWPSWEGGVVSARGCLAEGCLPGVSARGHLPGGCLPWGCTLQHCRQNS